MKKILILILFLLFPNIAFAAYSAATVWEYRTTGTATAGGAFVAGASGEDYSQQDAVQVTLTDAVIGADTTTFTSVLTPVDSTWVGNMVNFTSGTGWTVQRAQIVSEAAGVATCDRSLGTTGSTGGNGKMGGALDLMTDALLELLIAGNTVWIKGGTYTLTGGISIGAATGTEANAIFLEGYQTARGDNPTGTNRPLITAGANTITWGSYFNLKYLRVTSTASNAVNLSAAGTTLYNCHVNNTSAVSTRSAIVMSNYSRVIASEAQCASCRGFLEQSTGYSSLTDSYVHDCDVCIKGQTGRMVLLDNVFDTCTTSAIDVADNFLWTIRGNTIYNSGTGVLGTTPGITLFMKNIFNSNTTGVNYTTTQTSEFLDWNNWNNNGTDVSGVTKGDNETSGAPGFDDAANGDFDIGSTLRQTAAPYPGANQGLTNSQNYGDPGALQRNEVSGGGTNANGAVSVGY